MDQLFETCDQCRGTGQTQPTPERASGSFGRRVIGSTSERCAKCNGAGRVLTAAGQAIRDVVEHVGSHGR
jgi:DnaJ-class molecular chaperone